jgi:hypothetical protein
MNQGTQGYSLTIKTEGRKSRDTVSLMRKGDCSHRPWELYRNNWRKKEKIRKIDFYEHFNCVMGSPSWELPKDYYVRILSGTKGEWSSIKIVLGLKGHSASNNCFVMFWMEMFCAETFCMCSKHYAMYPRTCIRKARSFKFKLWETVKMTCMCNSCFMFAIGLQQCLRFPFFA